MATRWNSQAWVKWASLFLITVGCALNPWFAAWDRLGLDLNYRLHQRLQPRRANGPEVVIVGLDDRSARELPEPLALYHRPLGRFMEAMVHAQPAAVGLDLILPERSWDGLLPGSDAALARGILRLNRTTPLVLGRTDNQGIPRPVHAPFETVAGRDNLAFVQVARDPDQRLRRFETRLGESGAVVSTFAGRLAERLGHPSQPGLVNFTLGPAFGYTPLHQVLAWEAAGDAQALQARFAGKVVLLGSVLPYEDRALLPIRLAAWEPAATQDSPGVLMQAQILRTLLSESVIRQVPLWATGFLALLGAAAGLRLAQARRRGLAILALAHLALLLATYLLLGARVFLPVLGILGALDLGYGWSLRREARRRFQAGVEERRFLERALLDTAERERCSIGHELHDGVCQQISAALMRCRMVERTLGQTPEAAHLKVMGELLDTSLDEAHGLAQGLSPGDLEQGYLGSALAELARRTSALHTVACTFREDASATELSGPATTQLYRIAQEAVANAVKHGRPASIWIRLQEAQGQILLTVDNDGRPLGTAASPSAGGMGQRIMRYRAELLHGALSLEDRPEGGTRLRCSAPFSL